MAQYLDSNGNPTSAPAAPPASAPKTYLDSSGNPMDVGHPAPPAFPMDQHVNEAVKNLPPQHQEAARSGFASVLHTLADPWIATGYDVMAAYQRGTAHFYDTMEVLKRDLADAEPAAMKRTPGFRAGGTGYYGDEMFKNLADTANKSADEWKAKADKEGLPFMQELIGNAVGGAVPQTLEFFMNVASGLTIPLEVGSQRAKENKSDPHHTDPVIGGLIEAAKTGTLAMLFEMLGPFSKYIKATAFGSVFGAQAASEAPPGQRLRAGAMGAGTGMLIGGIDGGGNTGVSDLYPDLGKTVRGIRERLDQSAGIKPDAPASEPENATEATAGTKGTQVPAEPKPTADAEASVGQPSSVSPMRNSQEASTGTADKKQSTEDEDKDLRPSEESINNSPKISELTQALKSIPRDASFDDRMNIAEIARQKIGGVLGATETAFNGVKAVAEAAKDWYTKPPQWTDFDDMFGKFLGARQRNGLETDRFGKQIIDSMPARKQRAITNYMQVDGDREILQQRADKTADPELKQGYEDALTLTDQEKGFASDIRAHWDRDLDENIKAGILDHGVENYVSQVWKKSPDNPVAQRLLAEANSGKLSRNPAYAKKRIFDSYFEGEQAGFTPKDKRVGFLIAARQKAFDDATAARRFITQISKGNATDGRPLVVTNGIGQEVSKGENSDPVYYVNPNATGTVYAKDSVTGQRLTDPETQEPIEVNTGDYKIVNHPALRKQKWVAKDSEGNSVVVQGDLKVHPEIYKRINSFLGKSAVRETAFGRGTLKVNAEIKGTLLGFFSPFHQVHLSQTAATHGVNAAAELLPDTINLDDPVTTKLIDHGLTLYDHDGMAAFSSGSETTGLERYIPVVGRFSSEYQNYLFGPDGFVPRLKERSGKVAYERNRTHYPELSDDQVAKLSADQTNASFGGQNYEMMGRSKTAQDLMRLGALAPNFLEARARSVAQGLMPYGREQFTAIAIRGAIGMYILARITEGIAHQIDPDKNEVHWDKPFSATIDGREYTLRSEQGDIQHLITDPRSFVYYRLSPGIMKPAIEAVTARDNWGRKRDATEQLKDWATAAVPIAGQGFFAKKDYDLYQSIMGSFGISSFNARTEAEKTIMDISHENNLETRPAATQKRMAIKGSLGDKFLKTGDFGPVEAAVEKGQITPKDAQAIMGWSMKGDSLSGVRSFSVPDTLKVWDKANDKEKAQLQETIIKKWMNWNATQDERDEFSDQINSVMAWQPPVDRKYSITRNRK